MPFRLHHTVLAAALLGAAGLPAAAQAANPAPCNDTALLDDEWGDQVMSPLGQGVRESAAADNFDLKRLWLDWDGKALTANLQVAKADTTVPAAQDSQGGIAYYVFYKLGEQVNFIRALNQTGAGYTFAYGHIQDIAANGVGLFSVYQTDGDTTGKLYEGEDGVVQMVIPEAVGGKAGTTLLGVEATADYFTGPDDLLGINNHADEAPDGADVASPNGADYTVAKCVPATTSSTTTTTARSRAAKRAMLRFAKARRR